MSRLAIPSYFFALAVVRRGNQFLLVHERKHSQGWYLPGGRVEPGESFEQAVRRETLEETGLPIELEGIVRIEHAPSPDGTRLRMFFLAHPLDDRPPRTTPDEESLGAAWVRLEELPGYRLRAEDLRDILAYVARGCFVGPLGMLTIEGGPWR